MKTNPNDPIDWSKHRETINSKRSGEPAEGLSCGLSKREYFAAMAMQGLLASLEMPDYDPIHAKYAVLAADALIKELNKEQK